MACVCQYCEFYVCESIHIWYLQNKTTTKKKQKSNENTVECRVCVYAARAYAKRMVTTRMMSRNIREKWINIVQKIIVSNMDWTVLVSGVLSPPPSVAVSLNDSKMFSLYSYFLYSCFFLFPFNVFWIFCFVETFQKCIHRLIWYIQMSATFIAYLFICILFSNFHWTDQTKYRDAGKRNVWKQIERNKNTEQTNRARENWMRNGKINKHQMAKAKWNQITLHYP